MKTFFFKKNLKRVLQQEQRLRKFVNYANAQRILLLYQCGITKNKVVKAIIEQLEADGKIVEAYCYSNAKKTEETESNKVFLIDNKSLNFLGKPNSKVLDKIGEQHYDLLIDLSLTDCYPLLYLALYSRATMKAGTNADNSVIFDFIIDKRSLINNDLPQQQNLNENILFDKIIFYLKNIQTND
ncbi:MAG: hypothetical protein LBV75_03115 [Paludibacter sp.]|jgi:hypothetical protein|nr:hypothetical protein [Paludibacter sp.]